MAIALSLHGLAQTWQQLLFMRALAGVAGGLLSGSAVSYVGDYFPVERRGWGNRMDYERRGYRPDCGDPAGNRNGRVFRIQNTLSHVRTYYVCHLVFGSTLRSATACSTQPHADYRLWQYPRLCAAP